MSQQKKLIRNKFRTECLERDKNTCRGCGYKPENTNELDVHHIVDRHEFENGGYVKENGISLCSDCHLKAEKFHQTDGKEWISSFHPDNLFELIKSNQQLAKAADRKNK